MRLVEFPDEAAWIQAVVDELAALVTEAREGGRRRLELCLAGGSTPAPIYAALAARPLVGPELGLWPGDERAVGPDDPARNGAMIARAFAGASWQPAPRLRLWPAPTTRRGGETGPPSLEQALTEAETICARHEMLLRAELGDEPVFDLALLGLGSDGHTASLFPGQSILAESSRLCAASLAPTEPRVRMSFSYPLLARTRKIRFLVRGVDKERIVRRLARNDASLPASRIGAADQAIFYCRTGSGPV